MRRWFVLLALLVPLATMPGLALAQNEDEGSGGNPQAQERLNIEALQDKQEVVPGQVIVKYKDSAGPTARHETRRSESLEKKKDLSLIGAEVDKIKRQSVSRAIHHLENDPDVAYAEPDYVVRSTGYTDEPRFGELWGLDNTGQVVGSASAGTLDVDVNAAEASAVTQGSQNIIVAVIDDGVDFGHPDLAGREWTNPGESGGGKETNGVDDDGNGYVDDVNGWDFLDSDNTVHDAADYHGTAISGIIAASVNGEGIVGVAPNVEIMALKFLGPNGGSTSDAILALQYAKAEGAKISNNSWGGGGYSRALRDAIEASSMLFVASAGNDGLDTDVTPHYPSSYTSPNILSVAAVNNQGELAGFSNYGVDSVDLSAPGVTILSSVPGASWVFFNGTSIATPYVTGVAALAASDSPYLLSNPPVLKGVIMDSGKVISATTGETRTGMMVDAEAALAPVIIAVFPKAKAKNISPNANVTAAFSKDMLASSINAGTFTLTRKGASTPVGAVVSYDPVAKKAMLNPNRNLRRGAIYIARIKGESDGVRDLKGNMMLARKVWSFKVRH